jgi:hypothetical protein
MSDLDENDGDENENDGDDDDDETEEDGESSSGDTAMRLGGSSETYSSCSACSCRRRLGSCLGRRRRSKLPATRC